MSAKEVLLQVAEKLPPNATLADAIAELQFQRAAQTRRAELDRIETNSATETEPCSPSPAWHADILSDRLAKIESGQAEFLTLDNLKEKLRNPRR